MAEGPVGELARRWLKGRVERREISRGTWERHRTILRGFTESVGRIPVGRLSRRHVERWLASRGDIAPGTRRVEFSTVRAFCRWLVVDGYVKRDPFLHVRVPRTPRAVPRALTRDDTAALVGCCPDSRARAAVALLLGLGLRRGEAVGVQLGDWDRAARILYVVGKGGHTRMLPVPDDVAHALGVYLDEHPASAGPLLRCWDGRPMTGDYLGRLVSRWMADAGVKHAPRDGRSAHALRHTLASEVADVEPDLRVVQAILGHVSLSSTQIYLRRADLGKVRVAIETAALLANVS